MNVEQCYRAIETRDKQYDGEFVYGVKSTGIYCRPSCPSRKPDRGNIELFPIFQAAEKAGYRACFRCRPREADVASPRLKAVQTACEIIRRNIDSTPSLDELAAETAMSKFHLQKVFKDVIGMSPKQYAEQLRVDSFKEGIREGSTVTEALYDAGYSSSSRLYEKAFDLMGMTPATYKKGGRGAMIKYAFTTCSLGVLLVAWTGKGVCFVCFGTSENDLLDDLRQEYYAADIVHADDEKRYLDIIAGHVDGSIINLNLPLDIRVTAFQFRVLSTLRKIPAGETWSYSDVAQAMGRANAVRAVANACAANPVAVVFPCHRVVRKDGSVGGYRWGAERKEKFLEIEHERSK